jgi:hypothetical protein
MSKDKPNLHEIDERIRTILDDGFDPATGQVFDEGRDRPDMEDLLNMLDMDRTQKILHCMKYREEHDIMVDGIKKIESKLAKRRKQHEKRSAFLKRWVEDACNLDEVFESPDMKVTFLRSERIEIRDFDAVPKHLVNVTTTEAVDKNRVKDWIKAHDGEAPSGIDLVVAKNVQVK